MKYYKVTTYGCQMNVHESEKISGIMEAMGYKNTEDDNLADVIIFNTCCIRDNAERRAIGNISGYKKLKKTRPELILIVLGCMTEQKETSEYLYQKFPFIDIILGNHNKFDLEDAIENRIKSKKRYFRLTTDDACIPSENKPISRTSGTNAWINIMYGCNNFCSYCIVPYVRGRERSRRREDIVKEVSRCLSEGYKEITLLGQNVNSYGIDLNSGYTFPDLLEELSELEGKFRINYMTSHPKDFNKRVVDIIKSHKNISHYIHLPIQSGSDKILNLMNRRYTREKYMDIIDYIRQEISDAGITTDIMVGFPNESEEDFLDTLDIIKRVRFSNAFMFIYSPRKGTPAAEMEQVDEGIKNERIKRLIDLQRQITREQSKELIGTIQEVLIEDISPKYEDMYCGRTDNGRLVHFESKGKNIGEFIPVKIVSNKSAALLGVYSGENDEEN